MARPDAIDRPVFLQIERTDIIQFSTGLKAAAYRHVTAFFNALLPLNQQSVRSDRVLVLGIESVF